MKSGDSAAENRPGKGSTLEAIIYQAIDADHRLVSLGTSRKILDETRNRGVYASLNVTDYHAVTAGGTFAYHEMLRSLREFSSPNGWTVSRRNSLELTVNSVGTVAIVIRAGTSSTGRPEHTPQTRSENGSQTVRYIRVNKDQPFLFSTDGIGGRHPNAVQISIETRVPDESIFQTWVLLHFRDTLKDELRSELSLPVLMNEQGHVEQWRERIMLDPIDFGSPDFSIVPTPEPEPTSEVEVKIKRRG